MKKLMLILMMTAGTLAAQPKNGHHGHGNGNGNGSGPGNGHHGHGHGAPIDTAIPFAIALGSMLGIAYYRKIV